MDNILLTRIDNRLVHGQVGVTWTKTIGCNLIVVVDDEVSESKLQQSLMSTIAKSSGVGIRFFSTQKTIDVIEKASPSQKIFLVCRTPDTVRTLIEGGVNLKSVNIGNMHYEKGKRQIGTKVYVNDKDVENLNFINENVKDLFIQDIPGNNRTKYENINKED